MKIHSFQHVPYEDLAAIEPWAIARGHTLSHTRFFDGEPLPNIENIDWLVVMGGPMNIYQTDVYPWLLDEKRFIESAIARDKTVLGVCLGSQLVADVLGAKVTRNAVPEIGWFPIEFTPQAATSPIFADLPPQFPVLHWHGDTFALPDGVVHIARSENCENQAFVYKNNVVGLQFHLETTPQNVQEWLDNSDELVPEKTVQTAHEILSREELFRHNNQTLHHILDRLETVSQS